MSRISKIVVGLTVVVVALSGWLFVTKGSSKRPVPMAGSAASPLPVATPTSPEPNVVPLAAPIVASQSPVPTGDRRESSAQRAAAGVVALDEQRMVSEQTAATMTAAITSKGARAVLTEQAIRQTRSLHRQLGENIVVFAQPLRVRTIAITETTAEIDVWWVKVVSSETQPNAGDIWGTTRVSLIWEDNAWKESNEASRLGPWPTHASDRVTHPSGASFLAQLNGFLPLTTTGTTTETGTGQ
jgi:hypothetical protein